MSKFLIRDPEVETPFVTRTIMETFLNIRLLDDDHVQSSSSHRHMDDNRLIL